MSDQVSVVFAGGGCRTFWALGVLDAVRDQLGEVREWAGVSAGASMATLSATGVSEAVRDKFAELTAANPRNFYPQRMVLGQRPFPHEGIYREALDVSWTPENLERLEQAGPVRLLLAYVLPGHRPVPTALRGFRRYSKRKKAGMIHGPDSLPVGIGIEVVTAQQAQSPAELTDWILCSSATPPIVPSPAHLPRSYVDGGVIDNVPVRALSEEAQAGPVLVLLNRPVPPGAVFERHGHLYIAPTTPVPIAKWDYASPERIDAAWRAGLAAGRAAREGIERYLS